MVNNMFKFWSTTQAEAIKELHPDLGHRNWNELSTDEKDKVWHFLSVNNSQWPACTQAATG